jgi:hypothetical protein
MKRNIWTYAKSAVEKPHQSWIFDEDLTYIRRSYPPQVVHPYRTNLIESVSGSIIMLLHRIRQKSNDVFKDSDRYDSYRPVKLSRQPHRLVKSDCNVLAHR